MKLHHGLLYIIFCRVGFNIEIRTRQHEQEGSKLSIAVELSTDKRKALYKFKEKKKKRELDHTHNFIQLRCLKTAPPPPRHIIHMFFRYFQYIQNNYIIF